MTPLDVVTEALRSAHAAWTGCDWDIEFGPSRTNLRGLCGRQARLAAQATRGDESAHRRAVCRYLHSVERDARTATQLACAAVAAWRLGNISEALRRLEDAIAVEGRYHDPVAYPRLRQFVRPDDCRSEDAGKKVGDTG